MKHSGAYAARPTARATDLVTGVVFTTGAKRAAEVRGALTTGVAFGAALVWGLLVAFLVTVFARTLVVGLGTVGLVVVLGEIFTGLTRGAEGWGGQGRAAKAAACSAFFW